MHVHGLSLLMVRGPMRGSESICPAPASLPLSLRLGCSIKVSESMVWVLCLWVNYGYSHQGTPERVNQVYCWELDEREKQREGNRDTGQFKGSQCQVLKCLFSSTGVLVYKELGVRKEHEKQITNVIYDIHAFASMRSSILFQ